jgi:hypothetical protein
MRDGDPNGIGDRRGHPPLSVVVSDPPVDVQQAQVDAINCLIEIIDEPYTGNDSSDFLLRRNKIEAARALFQLKTRMLREIEWKR